MARPLKDGVDYFPKDTDFYHDDKVRMLRAEFGAKGMYMLDYLLCEIYGKNGYFIKWDNSRCFLASDGAGCGCSPEYISEFISGCIRCSFFDKRVFDVFGVLTSAGIQRRYIRMFNSRDEIQIIKEYWLLNEDNKKDVPASVLNKVIFKTVKSTGNPDKSTGNPDKSTGNVQSKVNKSKINKNKINIVLSVPEEIKEEWDAYVQMRTKIKKPLTDYAASLALKELERLAPNNPEQQKKILNQSTFKCWQGLFPLKAEDIGNSSPVTKEPWAKNYDDDEDFLKGR